MRAKRAKAYKKVMSKYQYSFGHRPPYQVLLDDQFIVQAAANKMRLGSMLQNTLGDEIKPMITQCCIRHLYTAQVEGHDKTQKDAWIEVAKQAERRRCGHHELEQPLSTLECLLSVVDPKGSVANKHRYVVACQEPEVRARMREIAGVPLIYINRSVMILEPMAAKSTRVREADEKGKIRAGLKGSRPTGAGGVKRKREEELDGEEMPARARAIVAAAMNGEVQAQGESTPKKRKVKGPKGPNPLSMRKAKKGKPTSSVVGEAGDEQAAVHKAAKKASEDTTKASDAEVAVGETSEAIAEASRKRKRKRRPREGGMAEDTAGAAEEAGGDED